MSGHKPPTAKSHGSALDRGMFSAAFHPGMRRRRPQCPASACCICDCNSFSAFPGATSSNWILQPSVCRCSLSCNDGAALPRVALKVKLGIIPRSAGFGRDEGTCISNSLVKAQTLCLHLIHLQMHKLRSEDLFGLCMLFIRIPKAVLLSIFRKAKPKQPLGLGRGAQLEASSPLTLLLSLHRQR